MSAKEIGFTALVVVAVLFITYRVAAVKSIVIGS